MKKIRKRFYFFYFLIFSLVSIYLFFVGILSEPLRQLLFFFTESKIPIQEVSWGTLDILIGFIFLGNIISFVVVFTSFAWAKILKRKKPAKSKSIDKFEKKKILNMIYSLLGVVAREEIIFRWIPLTMVLYFSSSVLLLWTVIIASSVIFGLIHIVNYKKGERLIYQHTNKVVDGLIYSYIFLAFGFLGVFIVHYSHDLFFVFLPKKILSYLISET